MTSILGYPILEWVFWINVGIFTAVIQYLMWRRIYDKEHEKAAKEYEEKKALLNERRAKIEKEYEEQKALLQDEKEYLEYKALLKVLSCDECGIRVDGHADGWHDHSKHGELTVCIDCSDICEACGPDEPCECEVVM